MLKIRLAAATGLMATVAVLGVLAASPQQPREATPRAQQHLLTGTIRSASGGVLEGVTVSAKREGSNITTSVYTDGDGMFILPAPAAGAYEVWAQAVGFGTGRAQLTVGTGEGSASTRHNFVLNTIADPSRQMSSADWYATFPEDTPENIRMKNIFRTNCSGCHQPNYVLQNRFDEDGWRAIIDRMAVAGVTGGVSRRPWPIIQAHKDELAKYLARMRGPESTIKLTPLPRPRGDEALVVITEYDVDLAESPGEFALDNGSIWAEGVPSSMNNVNGTHDIEIDFAGNIWVADSAGNQNRTYAKIDAVTGQITSFKVEANGRVRSSHGMRKDKDGIIWFDLSGVRAPEDNVEGGTAGSLARLDPLTGKLDVYTPPRGMSGVGGAIDVDGKGKIWASTGTGAIRFDPMTQQFAEFKSPQFQTPQGSRGNTYGVAADADGYGYAAQMSIDIVSKGDVTTGEVLEIRMPDRTKQKQYLTEADRKLYASAPSDWNTTYPYAQGPRRLSGDPRGTAVWVGNWWGENLARIDIKTNKVTEYPVPHKDFGGPYATVVDNHSIVWMNMMNGDSVLRFDPKNERFTEYRLPTRGAETRHIAVLDRGQSPVVVVPYWRSSKVAKLEFRTPEEAAALKRQVQATQAAR